jgi:hypothetical protein
MSNLQKSIAEKFLSALGKEKNVDADMVKQLHALLDGGKKLKPDDLVKAFTSTPNKDVR